MHYAYTAEICWMELSCNLLSWIVAKHQQIYFGLFSYCYNYKKGHILKFGLNNFENSVERLGTNVGDNVPNANKNNNWKNVGDG